MAATPSSPEVAATPSSPGVAATPSSPRPPSPQRWPLLGELPRGKSAADTAGDEGVAATRSRSASASRITNVFTAEAQSSQSLPAFLLS